MKKCFAILSTMLISAVASAQSEVSWQVFAGYNNSTVTDFDGFSGFHVGVIGEIGLPQLNENVYANAGLEFVRKGCAYSFFTKYDVPGNFLQVPVHIGYRHALSDDLSAFAEVGPYVSFGISGSYDAEVFGEKSTADAFGDDGYYNRFDLGAGLKAGVEYQNKYVISLGYDKGFINCLNDEDSDEDYGDYDVEVGPTTGTFGCFYITLGFKF